METVSALVTLTLDILWIIVICVIRISLTNLLATFQLIFGCETVPLRSNK